MSERPIREIKLPELKDLVIALKDLVECHALGLQLGLPESKLALIDKHPVENHLRMMLSEWLQFDTEASWEKLSRALGKIGKNAIAANIRQEFMIVSGPPTQSLNLEQEAKRRMYPYYYKSYPIYPDNAHQFLVLKIYITQQPDTM